MKISDYLYPAKGAQLLPGYTKDDMTQVTVTIQNEVIKKKKFDRLRYYPDVGFHFFDGAYEYEVLSISYLDNPCYPILNLGRLDHQLLAA